MARVTQCPTALSSRAAQVWDTSRLGNYVLSLMNDDTRDLLGRVLSTREFTCDVLEELCNKAEILAMEQVAARVLKTVPLLDRRLGAAVSLQISSFLLGHVDPWASWRSR